MWSIHFEKIIIKIYIYYYYLVGTDFCQTANYDTISDIAQVNTAKANQIKTILNNVLYKESSMTRRITIKRKNQLPQKQSLPTESSAAL